MLVPFLRFLSRLKNTDESLRRLDKRSDARVNLGIWRLRSFLSCCIKHLGCVFFFFCRSSPLWHVCTNVSLWLDSFIPPRHRVWRFIWYFWANISRDSDGQLWGRITSERQRTEEEVIRIRSGFLFSTFDTFLWNRMSPIRLRQRHTEDPLQAGYRTCKNTPFYFICSSKGSYKVQWIITVTLGVFFSVYLRKVLTFVFLRNSEIKVR